MNSSDSRSPRQSLAGLGRKEMDTGRPEFYRYKPPPPPSRDACRRRFGRGGPIRRSGDASQPTPVIRGTPPPPWFRHHPHIAALSVIPSPIMTPGGGEIPEFTLPLDGGKKGIEAAVTSGGWPVIDRVHQLPSEAVPRGVTWANQAVTRVHFTHRPPEWAYVTSASGQTCDRPSGRPRSITTFRGDLCFFLSPALDSKTIVNEPVPLSPTALQKANQTRRR